MEPTKTIFLKSHQNLHTVTFHYCYNSDSSILSRIAFTGHNHTLMFSVVQPLIRTTYLKEDFFDCPEDGLIIGTPLTLLPSRAEIDFLSRIVHWH